MGATPVVGRADEIAGTLRALGDPTCDGVFLVATEPGAGATTVLDAVLDRLQAAGRPANRIVASRGASATPYAALAHVLPMPLPADAHELDPLAVFARIRERVAGRGGADRFVTAVDDIRWLDERSLALLSTLLAAKLVVVVATLRSGEPVPDAVAAVERSCAVRRMAIGRLGRDDSDACLGALLAGAIDGALAHEVFSLSRGNPLFLREVVAGGVAAGTIRRDGDVWVLQGRLAPTARLESVLDAELVGLSADAVRALELLAICEPVDVRALERLGLGTATDELDARGLVSGDEDALTIHVSVVQPLLAALLRARMSPLRRRARLREAVGAIGPYARPSDRLRLAGWMLDAGLDVATSELLAAAQQARAAHDAEAVQRLATAALTAGPNGEALVLHAEALQTLGRFDEAEASLLAAEADARDDRARLAVALVRQRILLWSGVEAGPTRDVLEADRAALADAVARDLVVAAMATMEAIAGRASACLELAGQLESGSDVAATAMAFPLAVAETRLGRPGRAIGIARSGGEQAASATDAYGPGHAATLALAEGVALAECGDFAAAEGVLRRGYREVVERRIPHYQAWMTSGLARLDVLRARPVGAERWFAECRAVSRRIAFEPGERAATAGSIVCAGLAGDVERVRRLAGAARVRWGGLERVWPDGPVAEAWAALVDGAPDPTAPLVRSAVEALRLGELATVNQLAYEAVRFGAASLPAELIEAVAGAGGPLAAARADAVRGVCRAEVPLLERAERAFAELGVALCAAEAAIQLSQLCHRLGRSRQAAAAAARSDTHRIAAGDARSPLLARPAAAVALSGREAEIAALAASGVPSKEIAARLGLSVRTVSNHLQNVYTKLGVTGRGQLGDLLPTRNG
jgi:DNA-binding CsgD family transcriptional regulator